MTKLIDADALTIAVFKKAIDDAFLNGNTDMHRLLIQVIAHQPTIDAEPVIRCKDCKYNSNTEGNYVNCDIIPQMFGKTPDNNYCSWAESKEGN